MTSAIGSDARCLVVQDVEPLLSARRHHSQHPHHEPAPARAVGPPADPPPVNPRERPQTRFPTQDLGTTPARRPTAAARHVAQRRLDLAPQSSHRRAEPLAIDLVFFEPVPPADGPKGKPLRRDQGASGPAMLGLPAPVAPARGLGRLAIQTDEVGRRGLGGVGGVEFESGLEIVDALLQLRNPWRFASKAARRVACASAGTVSQCGPGMGGGALMLRLL